jgi:hypothetical protein
MEQNDVLRTRELLRRRREAHREALRQEVERLTIAAKELGGQWMVLVGSQALDRAIAQVLSPTVGRSGDQFLVKDQVIPLTG